MTNLNSWRYLLISELPEHADPHLLAARVRKEVLAHERIRFFDYAPGRQVCYFAADPGFDAPARGVLEQLESIGRTLQDTGAISGFQVRPYSDMRVEQFGGAYYLPVHSRFNHLLSKFTIDVMNGETPAERSSPTLLAMFAVVVTYENFTLGTEEVRMSLKEYASVFCEDAGVDPNSASWDESRKAFARALSDVAPVLQDLRVRWSRLADHVNAGELAALRLLDESLSQEPVTREMMELWTRPAFLTINKRINHQTFIRFGVDNHKELLCIDWLSKL